MLIAFPRQQWLHERAEVFVTLYVRCLVFFVYPYVTLDICPSVVVRLFCVSSFFGFSHSFSLLMPFGRLLGENLAVHRNCCVGESTEF